MSTSQEISLNPSLWNKGKSVEELQIQPGDFIYEEGQKASMAYLILEGEAELYENRPHGHIATRRAKQGELIGEMGLLAPHGHHHNSAKALSEALVFAFTRTDFETLVAEAPTPLVPIIAALFNRMLQDFDTPQQTKTPTKPTVEAMEESEAAKVVIRPGNQFTAELIEDFELPISHLPLRIGGFAKDKASERNRQNHVNIPCEGTPLPVSHSHCEVVSIHGKLHIRDLGSRLGTTVNGTSIGRGKGVYTAPLQEGKNEVIFGDKHTSPFHLQLEISGA